MFLGKTPYEVGIEYELSKLRAENEYLRAQIENKYYDVLPTFMDAPITHKQMPGEFWRCASVTMEDTYKMDWHFIAQGLCKDKEKIRWDYYLSKRSIQDTRDLTLVMHHLLEQSAHSFYKVLDEEK